MSNVSRHWWKFFKGTFSSGPAGTEGKADALCACLDDQAFSAYENLPDFISIHQPCGQAIWVSEKSLGLFCKEPQELMGAGLQNLIGQDGSFDFSRHLKHCALSGAETSHNIRIHTAQVNTCISFRLVAMDPCASPLCPQRIMLIARPENMASRADPTTGQAGPLEFKASAKPLDLQKSIRDTIRHYSENYAASIRLVIEGDEASIPTVHLDPILLKMLLEQIYDHVSQRAVLDSEFVLHLSRTARSVQLRLSTMAAAPLAYAGFAGHQGEQVDVDPVTDNNTASYQLARLLGGKLVLPENTGGNCLAELTLPINAGIALPAPELLAAELIHIRKAANRNSSTNPIPRKWKAG